MYFLSQPCHLLKGYSRLNSSDPDFIHSNVIVLIPVLPISQIPSSLLTLSSLCDGKEEMSSVSKSNKTKVYFPCIAMYF